MPQFLLLLLAISFFALVINAQTIRSPSTWTWENYKGVSQWRVQVTDDETACGADAPFYETYSITMRHNMQSASADDFGHGPISGTFSGNNLRVEAKSFPDSGGTAYIPAVSIAFSPDCMSFDGSYVWNWDGPNGQQCSGPTRFHATRTDAQTCPGQLPTTTVQPPPVVQPTTEQLRAEITSARADLDSVKSLRKEAKKLQEQLTDSSYWGGNSEKYEDMRADLKSKNEQLAKLQSKVDAEYQRILKDDPDNFWANWDMAELRKSQDNYMGYFDYFDRAAGNEKIFEKTRQALKNKAADDLGLIEFPTPDRSAMVRKLKNEGNAWQGGMIYNVNVPKDAATGKSWSDKLKAVFFPEFDEVIEDNGGLPGDK